VHCRHKTEYGADAKSDAHINRRASQYSPGTAQTNR